MYQISLKSQLALHIRCQRYKTFYGSKLCFFKCKKNYYILSFIILLVCLPRTSTAPHIFPSVANVTKLLTAASYDFSKYVIVVVLGKPFQLILVFVGKAGAYPSETPFRCSTQGQAPGLTQKH
jgi:hypothetical protein